MTLLNEAYMTEKQQNGQRVLETSLKITKMEAAVAEKLFWLSKTFSGSFHFINHLDFTSARY